MREITASEAIRAYHFAIVRTVEDYLPPLVLVDGIFRTIEEAQMRHVVLCASNLSGSFEIVRIRHDGEVTPDERTA